MCVLICPHLVDSINSSIRSYRFVPLTLIVIEVKCNYKCYSLQDGMFYQFVIFIVKSLASRFCRFFLILSSTRIFSWQCWQRICVRDKRKCVSGVKNLWVLSVTNYGQNNLLCNCSTHFLTLMLVTINEQGNSSIHFEQMKCTKTQPLIKMP